MTAHARSEIQEMGLNSAYDEIITEQFLLSVFKDVACAARATYVVQQGVRGKYLKAFQLSDTNHVKYFKLARQGEACVIVFDDSEGPAGAIAKHYPTRGTDTPGRLKKIATDVAELLAQQAHEFLPARAVIFLHDLQGILYLHLSDGGHSTP